MATWIIWLIVAVALVILEVLTQMMWALCLSIGAIGAFVCSLFTDSLEWQLVLLVSVATIAYIILLPFFSKHHNKKSDKIARTGMDALLGRHAVVTNEIKPGEIGRARIDGDNWQVVAPGVKTTIKAGEKVVVTAYDSIILTVVLLEPTHGEC